MSMTRRRLLDDTYKQTAIGNPIQVRSVARMRPEITMQGWTEQKKTTGAQLLDISDFETGAVSGTTSYAWLKFQYHLTEGETYTITNNGSTPITLKISYEQGGYSSVSKSNLTGSYSFVMTTHPNTPEGSELAVFIWVRTISELDELIKIVQESNIMLNEGSTALPYEPYTGGQPSPNPDYPQEIVSAGAWDEENEKYGYEIKIAGKNILDFSKTQDITNWVASVIQTGYSDFPVYVGVGKAVTISIPEKLNTGIILYVGVVLRKQGATTQWMYHRNEESLIRRVITVTAVEDYIWIRCITQAISTTFQENFGQLMIEYGTEATAYQPFTEQAITLTSDRPLTERDRLEKRNGVWGWVYGSDIVELDGSEDEAWVFSNTYGGVFYTKKYDAVKGKAYCDKYMYVGAVSDEFSTGIFSIGLGVYPNSIWLKNVDIPNIQTLKSTLAENPITMVYQTSTEAFVPLTETEQAALNALHSNYPTTVLSNGQNCGMTITYKTRKSLEANQ